MTPRGSGGGGPAAAATSPVWRTIAAEAPAVRTQWLAEEDDAAERADWWTALHRLAQDGEATWSTPVPDPTGD